MTDEEFFKICLEIECECRQCSKIYDYKTSTAMGRDICQSCITVNSRRKNKKKFIDYKGGKCQICGYNKYDGALKFHHIDPTKKDFAPSKLNNRSFKNAKEELDKCVLLCGNCHDEVHAGLHSSFQIVS
jgi:5-methylcytosine-specific restriction endonuclease McrA